MKKLLAPGEGVQINRLASYVKINTALGLVKVEATAYIPDAQGKPIAVTINDQLPQGRGVNYGIPINGFYITNLHSAAQTIDIDLQFGEIVDNSIAGTVAVSSLAEPGPITLSGTAYRRGSSSAALNTIVTPAANINGVKITALTLSKVVAGEMRCMIKQSAPASYDDGIGIAFDIGTGDLDNLVSLPLLVPAGWGLYEQASSAANGSTIDIAYEVL